jgi:RNA polymerase sigma-70 factor (ECF subfamily)
VKHNPDDDRGQPSAGLPGLDDAARYGEFIHLFSQHHSHILAYIYKLVHDHHDADDLFQRTSIVLWTRFDTYESGSNFLAWARQIAYFEACNFLRTSGRRRLRFNDDLLEMLADEQQDLADESDRRLEALTGCMRKLGGKDREVVRQAYNGEQTIKELADMLGWATQTLYNRLGRIRKQLMECVEQKLAVEENSV